MDNINYVSFPQCLSDCQSFQRTSSLNAKTVYMGEGIALCVVAGRFKMFVPAQELSLAPHLMLDGYWESWISVGFYKLVSVLNPSRIVNVGANLGYYTLLAASLLPNAQIDAYEPQPELCDLMKRSAVTNGFSNVRIHQKAVGITTGTGWLKTFGNLSADATLGGKPIALGDQAISVNISSLDQEGYEPIEFMLIDAEGFEFEVLKGSEARLDAARTQAIILEFSPERYLAQSDFVDWIVSKNFDMFKINYSGDFEPLTAEYLYSASSQVDLVLTRGLSYDVPYQDDHSPPPPYEQTIEGVMPEFLSEEALNAIGNQQSHESQNEPYIFGPTVCRAQHFRLPLYRYWCEKLAETPHYHRKQWEFVYICQSLYERNMLIPGKRGVGFGVGREPLVALFASRGLSILASDLEIEVARELGWVDTNQHSQDSNDLNERGICEQSEFERLVSFRNIDMNDIPADIGKFDFCWSSCAFEHLGSIQQGLDFVKNSVRLLNHGGIAVHTTEFNLSSNDETLDNNKSFVIFRKRDIEQLVFDMRAEGYQIETVDYYPGCEPLEQYVDLPPYKSEPHLRLLLADKFVSTSIGLIIRKP